MKQYYLIAVKKENGFIREFKLLDNSSHKERLEHLATCKKVEDLQEQGYEIILTKQLVG